MDHPNENQRTIKVVGIERQKERKKEISPVENEKKHNEISCKN